VTAALRHFRHALAFVLVAAGPALAADACPSSLFEDAEPGPRIRQDTPEAREARRHLQMVANVQLAYQACAIGDPAFSATFKPVYDQWRAKYRDAVSSYENNTRAKRYVQCGFEDEKRRIAADSPDGRADRARICKGVIGPGIQGFLEDGPR
jgi:hypothetical protein